VRKERKPNPFGGKIKIILPNGCVLRLYRHPARKSERDVRELAGAVELRG
jgi:hypothetical protein